MNHTLLITGGSGLLAVNWAAARQHINEIWLGLNNRQIAIGNTSTIAMNCRLADVINSVKPDIMIHTAAMTDVDYCEANEKQAIAVNCDLAASYAETAYKIGLPFVHISTDQLFDGRQPLLDETTPCQPINKYGRSKWLGERAVLNAHPDALVLRVNFFCWGPSYRPSFSDWILSNLSQKAPITLYEDVYFTPIYAGVLINIAHQLIAKRAKGIYNLTSSDRISKYDFGVKLAQIFGHNANSITPGSYKSSNSTPRPLDMSLNNNKVLNTLGIESLTIENSIIALAENKSLKNIFSSIDKNI